MKVVLSDGTKPEIVEESAYDKLEAKLEVYEVNINALRSENKNMQVKLVYDVVFDLY